jgi:predicted RNase H-like HicB family nuclease
VRGLPAAWPVDLIPAQEAGFFVDFLNLPNGWSEGENRDEALAQAEDLQGVRPL